MATGDKGKISLSILIVSWNTNDLLRQCLDSIYASVKDICFEIIVADNASWDGSQQMVKDLYPQVRFIENDENFGFAQANNQAYRISKGDYIMLLNPDTIVHEGAIDKLLHVLHNRPDCAIAAPKLLWSDGETQPSVGIFPSLSHELADALCITKLSRKKHSSRFYVPAEENVQNIDWACGACLLVRKSALKDSFSILDERYFMFSEEMDMCKMLCNEGWNICYEPAAVITHLGGASTAKVRQEMLGRLYESRFQYFAKHHGYKCANIYRYIVIPVHLVVRVIGYLPGIIMRKSEYTRQQTHPLSQIRLLNDLLHWKARGEGANE